MKTVSSICREAFNRVVASDGKDEYARDVACSLAALWAIARYGANRDDARRILEIEPIEAFARSVDIGPFEA